MSVLLSLFLGLVQGITEFLPISRSGHVSILQNLFGLDYSDWDYPLLAALLRLASIVSICVVYKDEVRAMVSDGVDFLRRRGDSGSDEPIIMKPPARALLFVFIGTIPMVLAVFFIGIFSRLAENTGFVGFSMLITGSLVFVSSKYIKKGKMTEKTMSITDAFIIGLAQSVAVLIPGLSRCATGISVGRARGLSGGFAIRFSILLTVPVMFGHTIVSLYMAVSRDIDSFSDFFVYIVGFVVAAIAGFFTIQTLRRMMAKDSFGNFAYYAWGIGALALILSFVLGS